MSNLCPSCSARMEQARADGMLGAVICERCARRNNRAMPDQLERSIAYFQRSGCGVYGESSAVLVTVRADRYWLKGDVFVAEYRTGAGRQCVTGISSKGRRLRRYWLTDIAPPHRQAMLVEVPCDLAKTSPGDTDLCRQAIAEAHARATSARRVGASIPAALPPYEA